jgi:hypothetical protein
VVTICTTRFNIHKFYVLPSQSIYVLCVDLREKTAIISLNGINWLVFIVEGRVFTARYELGLIFQLILVFKQYIYIYKLYIAYVNSLCYCSLHFVASYAIVSETQLPRVMGHV